MDAVGLLILKWFILCTKTESWVNLKNQTLCISSNRIKCIVTNIIWTGDVFLADVWHQFVLQESKWSVHHMLKRYVDPFLLSLQIPGMPILFKYFC